MESSSSPETPRSAEESMQLTRRLEDWSEEEIDALFTREEGWAGVGNGAETIQALRDRLTTDPNASCDTQDCIAVLNWAEEIRLYMHIMMSIGIRNNKRANQIARDAGCAFCAWMYRDAGFEWPMGSEPTQEELDAVRSRVDEAIRAHVAICPNHPMRALESKLSTPTTPVPTEEPE